MSDSLNIKKRIDAICDDFEDSWVADQLADLDPWLGQVDSEYRNLLLKHLIELDVELRCKSGITVSAVDYRHLGTEAYQWATQLIADGPKDTSLGFEQQTQDFRQSSSPLDANPTKSNSPELPATIGRYRVLEILGKGGFGLVYKAFDDQLLRNVAIKVPHAHLVQKQQDVEAYLREARTVAGLEHPNIVPVYDVGQSTEHSCYVVSKYVDGKDLAQCVQLERFTFVEIARLIALVAKALHYAHKIGIVHRDIKPANILVDSNREPFVTDFGLALQEEDIGSESGLAGTPAFMSPEQAMGKGTLVDGRSDIFSLGSVLYRLLTDRNPFSGSDWKRILGLITEKDVKPPRQIKDDIPGELEQICLKAMARDPNARYTTAADFAEDLNWFLAKQTSQVPGSQPRHHTIPGASNNDSDNIVYDDNVQFTVYRPKTILPDKWYPLLAFAHLSDWHEPQSDSDFDEPIREVQRQAEMVLGSQSKDFANTSQDSGDRIPRQGELTFVPSAIGVEFNPPQRSFTWSESIHREEFRMKANSSLVGQTIRGRLSVYLGAILISEIAMVVRVSQEVIEHDLTTEERVSARKFRRIYPCFASADRDIVDQLESYATLLGDEYLTQCNALRSGGELNEILKGKIDSADIFQLFWSSQSMDSSIVQQEYEYAISLPRQNWIRPIYWEFNLPSDPARGLPPGALAKIGFQRLGNPSPGDSFTAAVNLRPHYQREDLPNSIDMQVTENLSRDCLAPSELSDVKTKSPDVGSVEKIEAGDWGFDEFDDDVAFDASDSVPVVGPQANAPVADASNDVSDSSATDHVHDPSLFGETAQPAESSRAQSDSETIKPVEPEPAPEKTSSPSSASLDAKRKSDDSVQETQNKKQAANKSRHYQKRAQLPASFSMLRNLFSFLIVVSVGLFAFKSLQWSVSYFDEKGMALVDESSSNPGFGGSKDSWTESAKLPPEKPPASDGTGLNFWILIGLVVVATTIATFLLAKFIRRNLAEPE